MDQVSSSSTSFNRHTERAWLLQLLNWQLPLSVGGVILLVMLFIGFPEPRIALGLLFVVGFVGLLIWARVQALNDRLSRAMMALSIYLLLSSPIGAVFLPGGGIFLVMQPILAMIFALPIANDTALRRILPLCWLSSAAVIVISRLLPSALPLSALSNLTVIAMSVGTVGLIAMMLCQYRRRLMVLIEQMRALTANLQNTQVRLEQEVQVRTAALQASEARFRAIVEDQTEMVCRFLPDLTLTFVNTAYCRSLGMTADELLGQKCLSYTLPDDKPHVFAGLASLSTTNPVNTYECRSVLPDGSIVWEQWTDHAIFDHAGQIVEYQSVGRDVTERVRTEEQLRVGEERLRMILSNLPVALTVLDRDGIITLSEGKGLDGFGFQPRELVGVPLFERFNDFTVYLDELKRILSGTVQESSINTVYSGLALEKHIAPLRDAQAEICGAITLTIDVTERRRAEEERQQLERKMQEAQKLETIGVLARGIAHDFNNMLAVTMGNAQLALLDLTPESPAYQAVTHIDLTARRSAELVQQLLAYAGKGRMIIEPVDLTDLVVEMTTLLQASVAKTTTLRYHCAPNLPLLMADASQLRQIVMNFVVNASEALADTPGTIIVTTDLCRLDRAALATLNYGVELSPGSYVMLKVTDTGCGMSAETRARIFDPFFTTKFTGRGLGLAAVLGIVRTHKGAIAIDSTVGRGTTFTVVFPIDEQSSKNATPYIDEPPPLALPSTSNGHGYAPGMVLVVDDEAEVRQMTGRLLERLGFRVISAGDGQEAIDILRTCIDDISCILLDLTMPRMGGIATIPHLQALRPNVPITIMSGYSADEFSSQYDELGINGFLHKPFTINTLRKVLSNTLTDTVVLKSQESGG